MFQSEDFGNKVIFWAHNRACFDGDDCDVIGHRRGYGCRASIELHYLAEQFLVL